MLKSSLTAEQKREFGQKVNALKSKIEAGIEEAKEAGKGANKAYKKTKEVK